MAACADSVIAPGAEFNATVFERNGDAVFFFFKKILDTPFDRLFRLNAVIGKDLREESLAVEQGNRDHRELQVRSGADRIACKNAKASRIGRHGILQRDFHGKIGNQAFLCRQFICHPKLAPTRRGAANTATTDTPT